MKEIKLANSKSVLETTNVKFKHSLNYQDMVLLSKPSGIFSDEDVMVDVWVQNLGDMARREAMNLIHQDNPSNGGACAVGSVLGELAKLLMEEKEMALNVILESNISPILFRGVLASEERIASRSIFEKLSLHKEFIEGAYGNMMSNDGKFSMHALRKYYSHQVDMFLLYEDEEQEGSSATA